ncbi:MAG: multicopper oxidase domain-containing protein [Burkholderiaceae bacterium]
MNARIQSPVPAVDSGRRDTLRWAFGLSLGTALAPLAGCGGASATEDTLPEAATLASKNRQLDMTLSVRYASQPLDIGSAQGVYPGTAKKITASLRSFNGRYMAPTLVLNVGDTLRIDLRNELPANSGGQSALKYLNHQNSTNLHFHGLHVDPKEIRPGVFGDYVVDTPEAGVLPGASRQHEITIPENHTNGIYWYHPHLHGSSNVQVSSGMFGAIIVRDPNDRFIASPEIRERVMFVHKMNLTADGKTETFYDSVAAPTTAFLINGAYQPTIVMRPGEVQNWHFINAASFYPFNPVLDGHTLWHYARDGNVFDRRFRPINRETSSQFGNQQWPGNALYPGNRHSVVIKASDVPGTYYLRSAAAPSSQPEEIVARIVVEGPPMTTALPSAANLPRYSDHTPITDQELAQHGGKTRALVLAILGKDNAHLNLPIPAGEEWFVPEGDGLDDFKDIVFASGTFGAKLSPFQSELTVTQTVALNAVEEWTIYNMNGYPHPFHIHVNDSYVVKINGEDVTPFWADTIPLPPGGTVDKPTSVTFRMRFADFTGKYVWHCHALDHEDLGMMQLVEVLA